MPANSAAKTSSRAQAKSLRLKSLMLALEPRYVFDAALATDLYQIADTMGGPHVQPTDHGVSGEALIAAARSLEAQIAAASGPASDQMLADLIVERNQASSNHQIAFIDGRLADIPLLIAEIPAGTGIVIIDPTRDGVAQMVDAIRGRDGISAIHILSHGAAGSIELGTASLNVDTMSTIYRSALTSIHGNLAASADILVYGCDFGAGTEGAAAVELLSDLTGADVAASEDLTGAGALGGDWDLEQQTGEVEATSISADDYAQSLALTNTSAWSVVGNTATNTTNGVTSTITFSAGAGTNFYSYNTAATLNTTVPFANSAAGGASLGVVFDWDTTPEPGGNPMPQAATDAGTGTVTISFSTPVTNPIIHIDRIGGFGGFQQTDQVGNVLFESSFTNSSLWTLTTPGATMTKLAGVNHLDVTSTTIQRTPNVSVPYTGTSTESGTNGGLNTAAGSVQVNGTFTTLTFQLTGVGVEGAGGDGIEIRLAVEPAPANSNPDAVNDPQSVGGGSETVLATDLTAGLSGGTVTVVDATNTMTFSKLSGPNGLQNDVVGVGFARANAAGDHELQVGFANGVSSASLDFGFLNNDDQSFANGGNGATDGIEQLAN